MSTHAGTSAPVPATRSGGTADPVPGAASGAGPRPRRGRRRRGEAGMVTSEYATATIGGCGVACVLLALVPDVDDMLRSLIERGVGPIVGPFVGWGG
jgi:hypothetical protein